MSKFKIGDKVKVTKILTGTPNFDRYIGNKGEVISYIGYLNYPYTVLFASAANEEISQTFREDELELVEDNEIQVETNSFKERATKIGELVDTKQKAYGDSVTKAYELMKIFLETYKNEDSTYTIPESLLKHILLQVRMIDKQNRIFSNPDGDLMEENPYADTVGYGLLGMRMCEEENK